MSTWNDQTVQPSSTDENNGYIPIRVSGTTSLGQVSVTSLEAGIVATDAAVVGAETTRAEGAENALRNTINNEINRATNTETNIAATHADTTLSNVNMAGISSAQLQALWTAIVGANPSLTNLIAE